MINSMESQLTEDSSGAITEKFTTEQVIENGRKIISHLEVKAKSLEQEVAALMALSAEVARKSTRAQKGKERSSKLNFLEIYCEPNSQLVRVAQMYGLSAKRFTFEDGDLSTFEGQAKLWQIVEEEQPDHIWASPECRYWGNFSRWNMSKSPHTAHNIKQGRQNEKRNLSFCEELYWFQVGHRGHFHLEQPQGSEALVQDEVSGIVLGTYRSVFDMCEVGKLKVPQGNNFLRKRTVVLTTSKICHAGLDSRYCTKQHEHTHIKGQTLIQGRWENLSAYAARYTRGFSKNVIKGMIQSLESHELPMELDELCVPCHGVHARDQESAAEDIVKGRRLNSKQAEDLSGHVSISSRNGASYGPARTWKELFQEAEKLAPRVGTTQVENPSDLFSGIQMLVDDFDVVRVDVCRGTERFRVPTSGTDLVPLTYRLTVILDRDSGLVEMLGEPEKWQIRKAKPARISMTIFGSDRSVEIPNVDQGKSLAEGDRDVKSLDKEEQSSSSIMKPDASMEDAQPKVDTGDNPGVNPKDLAEPDVEMAIMGHPPKSVPRHGPRFLELSREDRDRDWIRQVHHRMGHPDPARFVQFLKSTHAAENIICRIHGFSM